MSFDIFFLPFEGGEATRSSDQSVLDVLDLLIVDRDGGWARIATEDGSADVYGLDDPGSGVMINHASGRAVWDVMFDLAKAAGFVVMPVGCRTCVLDESGTDLPDGMPEPIVTVRSGGDLLRAVESA